MQPQRENAGKSECTSLQHCINDIERQCTEQKQKLNRFRNTGKEYCCRNGQEHGLILALMSRLHLPVHPQSDAQQKTGCADHLADLETGRCDGCQKLIVGSHITCIPEVDQVRYPGKPQRILSVYVGACVRSGQNCIGAAEGRIVQRNRQHMMQAKRQQKPFQHSVDKRCQHR